VKESGPHNITGWGGRKEGSKEVSHNAATCLLSRIDLLCFLFHTYKKPRHSTVGLSPALVNVAIDRGIGPSLAFRHFRPRYFERSSCRHLIGSRIWVTISLCFLVSRPWGQPIGPFWGEIHRALNCPGLIGNSFHKILVKLT